MDRLRQLLARHADACEAGLQGRSDDPHHRRERVEAFYEEMERRMAQVMAA
nr:hypothetical protein [Halomonas socia]